MILFNCSKITVIALSMANNDSANISVQEERIIQEVVAGESTPVSSGASAQVNIKAEKVSTASSSGRAKSLLQTELGALSREKEQHKVRLQSLRKEVANIKADEWLYEPIEKLIGRGNP